MKLLIRTKTAFLLVVLFVFFSLIPPPGMIILVSVATAILCWEYSKLIFYQKQFLFLQVVSSIMCFLFYGYFLLLWENLLAPTSLLIVYSFLIALFWMLQKKGLSVILDHLGFIFMALFYIVLPPAIFLKIFLYREYGLWELVFLMGMVFSGDAVAYLMGHFLGKKKWMAHISPHKTWLGLMSGLIMAGVSAVFMRLIFVQVLSVNFFSNSGWVFILGVGIFFIAQTGDLWVSTLKRRAGVKDTGILLPGHGGLLDRLDGLLITLPFLYGVLQTLNIE